MSDEEDGLTRALPAVSDNEIAARLCGFLAAAHDNDITLGKTGRDEPRRHPFGSDGRAAGRMRGVGLNQFLEDLAPLALIIRWGLRRDQENRNKAEGENCQVMSHRHR